MTFPFSNQSDGAHMPPPKAPAEKKRVMDAFRSGEHHLLISTTVIEVGVDVPNATVMLAENAERFGLAQLHQVRGRIGRGSHASFCVLFDESKQDNEEARARLEVMVRTTDGFELADADLRLRGEGTLFDVRQSGMPDLKLARLAEDLNLVKRARARAFEIVDADPDLAGHPALLRELRSRFEPRSTGCSTDEGRRRQQGPDYAVKLGEVLAQLLVDHVRHARQGLVEPFPDQPPCRVPQPLKALGLFIQPGHDHKGLSIAKRARHVGVSFG